MVVLLGHRDQVPGLPEGIAGSLAAPEGAGTRVIPFVPWGIPCGGLAADMMMTMCGEGVVC